MKVMIISDTHFGYKNSSQHFIDYQKRFLDNILFPYCEKNGIDRILHLGDLFDNRKHVTIRTLNFVRKSFLEEIRNRGMKMDILPGNHDTAYKNTNNLCTLVEVLKHYKDCITVHMDPTTLSYDGFSIGLVPWIAPDNEKICLDFIRDAKCSVIVGHFALSGFKYIANSNIKSEGQDASLFSNYEMVLSGHYHTKSTKGNVYYLGSQYQFNWGDVDDRKFFHILDTETRELTQVENTDKIFNRFFYNDEEAESLEDIIQKDIHCYENVYNKYIRIIVQRKKDFHLFDKFVDKIKSFEPFDLTTVENYELNIRDDEDSNNAIEDTSTLIDNYVDNILETDLDKNKIKMLLQELYTEASMIDTL
jgi:DNA repair exonuclease SbcCD nuclease subunit